MMVLLLLSCSDGPVEAPAPTVDPVVALTRLSLDLRGVRPTLDEYAAVGDDRSALEPVVDDWMADPRFGLRYADLMAPVYRTPVTETDIEEFTYTLDDPTRFLEGMGAEPLRILARIAQEDLPWTELVTGDWTMVTEVMAESYPTDYPESATGWQLAHYTDDRPAAGVLSTNGLWWRYSSTLANANRGRANAVSRILLCRDYLDQQIEGDRDLNLLDEEAVANALATSDACVTCHASLDPMAAVFWGFYNHFGFSPTEQTHYHPERERLWAEYTGVGPAYQGQPVDGLADLGRAIARDPRYAECAVKRTFEQLLQRPATLDDTATLTEHRQAFLEGGLTVRALVRAVVTSPDYLTPPTDDPAASPWKLVTPWQYAAQVEDLTGFRFAVGGYDLFNTDTFGVRGLAGDVGADFSSRSGVEPTATMALVMERVAEAAAWYAVDQPDQNLITEVPVDAVPSEADAIAQLEALHLRVLGQQGDTEDVARTWALWQQLHALSGSPRDAWAGVLAYLMRHPGFVVY